MTSMLGTTPDLYRCSTGQRLHVMGCPHVNSALQPATPVDLDVLPVCTWCQAEIEGHGRTYYDTLEDALRVLGCHEGAYRSIREALQSVRFDAIWVTNCQSYVALGLDGLTVAGINKTLVHLKATDTRIELPGYRDSQVGGGLPADVRWGDTCERHFVVRSLVGGCDQCDD